MAKVELLVPIIFKWEGGWADDKYDAGGKTNMGITLATWKSCGYDKDLDGDIDTQDLKLITKQDVINVLKKYYWDRWKADAILNQSIANLLVDWVWTSGKWGITIPQRVLGVTQDGVVGSKTIEALNKQDSSIIFKKLWLARKAFIEDISKKGNNVKFKKGWLNRLNDYVYKA